LTRPGVPDLLDPAAFRPPDMVNLSGQFLASVLERLLRTAPTLAQIQGEPLAALTGATHAVLLELLVEIALQMNVGELPVSAADAHRLELPVRPVRIGPPNAAAADLRAFAQRLIEAAAGRNVVLPAPEAEQRGNRLRALAANRLAFSGQAVAQALETVGRKAVLDDPYADPPRARLSVPGLDLLEKLAPGVTAPARAIARLKAGSGRFPGWLRPDWFDDRRIEPVMACPTFAYPMYEPLYRYDRDWMIPGLTKIRKPEMATLLKTNNRFIEAYLVGLNHEMACQLLWHDYPTDQRGTYFDSFWTGETELTAKLHEPPWAGGSLGDHVKADLQGQLVMLVRGELIRRYPGVVAHATRQAGTDNNVPLFEADSPARTIFQIILPPDILLAGFSLTRARAMQADETWWFTLSENPTEPHFGLDPSRQEAISRENLIWDDFGVNSPGQFLSARRGGAIVFGGSQWGASSAQMAYLLFRLPARAAFRASKMIEGSHA
jgi:hypothetical protein